MSTEIEYMYQKGTTEIYLVDAVLSKACSRPLEKFVRMLYAARVEEKNLKKKCLARGDIEGAKQHEAL